MIDLPFEATVEALLQTPPPPEGTKGSRKRVKVKRRKAVKRKAARKRPRSA